MKALGWKAALVTVAPMAGGALGLGWIIWGSGPTSLWGPCMGALGAPTLVHTLTAFAASLKLRGAYRGQRFSLSFGPADEHVPTDPAPPASPAA